MESSVGQAYLAASRHRLAECVKKIKHCLAQLTDEQVWWRPNDLMNSIANIVLHLGHMQEIVYITRLQLGDAYKFEWVPASKEQGAP